MERIQNALCARLRIDRVDRAATEAGTTRAAAEQRCSVQQTAGSYHARPGIKSVGTAFKRVHERLRACLAVDRKNRAAPPGAAQAGGSVERLAGGGEPGNRREAALAVKGMQDLFLAGLQIEHEHRATATYAARLGRSGLHGGNKGRKDNANRD